MLFINKDKKTPKGSEKEADQLGTLALSGHVVVRSLGVPLASCVPDGGWRCRPMAQTNKLLSNSVRFLGLL